MQRFYSLLAPTLISSLDINVKCGRYQVLRIQKFKVYRECSKAIVDLFTNVKTRNSNDAIVQIKDKANSVIGRKKTDQNTRTS